jgi:hypothetical protein
LQLIKAKIYKKLAGWQMNAAPPTRQVKFRAGAYN